MKFAETRAAIKAVADQEADWQLPVKIGGKPVKVKDVVLRLSKVKNNSTAELSIILLWAMWNTLLQGNTEGDQLKQQELIERLQRSNAKLASRNRHLAAQLRRRGVTKPEKEGA